MTAEAPGPPLFILARSRNNANTQSNHWVPRKVTLSLQLIHLETAGEGGGLQELAFKCDAAGSFPVTQPHEDVFRLWHCIQKHTNVLSSSPLVSGRALEKDMRPRSKHVVVHVIGRARRAVV